MIIEMKFLKKFFISFYISNQFRNSDERNWFNLWLCQVFILQMLQNKLWVWQFIYWFSRLYKKEKATINPKNDDNKCFNYATTIALNFDGIKKDPHRASNIKLFINNYNWEEMNQWSKIEDWKNNLTIAVNFLYIKEKEICPAYISKIISNCVKQTILLMIPNEEKQGWHYLAVKNYKLY